MRTNIGDIFSIPIKETLLGFGQIIRKPAFRLYIVVFEKIYSEASLPSPEEIVKAAPLLMGQTLDGLLYNNTWKIVGNIKSNITNFPFPYYKLGTPPDILLVDYKGERLRTATRLEVDCLNYETTLSPIYFEEALKAWHKMLPWQSSFDEILYSNLIKQIATVESHKS